MQSRDLRTWQEEKGMRDVDVTSLSNVIMKIIEETTGLPFCEGRWASQRKMMELLDRRMKISRQLNANGCRFIQDSPCPSMLIPSCPVYNSMKAKDGSAVHDEKTALLAGTGWLDGPQVLCNECPMRNVIQQELSSTHTDPGTATESPFLIFAQIDSVLGEYNHSQSLRRNRLIINDFRFDGAMSMSFAAGLMHTKRHKLNVMKKLSPRFREVFGHEVPMLFSKPLCDIPHGNEEIPEEFMNALSILNARLDARIEVTSFDGYMIYAKVPLDSRESFLKEFGIRSWLSLYFEFWLKRNVETTLERPCIPYLSEEKCRHPYGICD